MGFSDRQACCRHEYVRARARAITKIERVQQLDGWTISEIHAAGVHRYAIQLHPSICRICNWNPASARIVHARITHCRRICDDRTDLRIFHD